MTDRCKHCGAPAPKRTITVRGMTYYNARHAAEALGVTEIAVHKARKIGKLDTLGLGRGSQTKSKEITVHGVTYRSQSDLARAYETTQSRISGVLSVARSLGVDLETILPPLPKTAE